MNPLPAKLPAGKLEVAKWMIDFDMKLKENDEEQAHERLMAEYENYTGSDEVISSHEIWEEMKSEPPAELLKSGIGKLDEILGGFLKGHLVVIAAPTKNGKTSFCVELTIRMKDRNPLWFPFEEPAKELIQKFLNRKEDPPLFFSPKRMSEQTLSWIEKRIIEAKVKYGTQIVFIDHLHFIVPFSSERQDLLIGEVMRKLKTMAKQWDVCIFIISHLKKTKMDREPDLEDLRDSSFTAQEADTVILLWRTTKRENGKVVILDEVNVSIQANRRTGRTGNVPMRFDAGRF